MYKKLIKKSGVFLHIQLFIPLEDGKLDYGLKFHNYMLLTKDTP